jgi:hypothetical protein
MKYLTTFIIVLYPIVFFAQVFNGNITFTTNADVASFGAGNYHTINGDMSITGTQVSDLSPLSSLTTINGKLQIGSEFYNQSNITSLTGLENVTDITDDLVLYRLTGILSLSGLSGLIMVGGEIKIEEGTLSSLSGLSSIQNVTGAFRIDDLPNLSTLSSFPSTLTSIGGNLYLDQLNITSLSGLENITSVGSLTIRICNNLTSIVGLSNLTTVNDFISFTGNPNLTNLNGFSGLTSIGGKLRMWIQDNLTDLTGLSNLTSVGELDFRDNTSLTNLNGLHNLTTVNGDFNIANHPILNDITALANISTFGGKVDFSNNDAMTTLNGFPSGITELGGGLFIENNLLLNDITALSNIQLINGNLHIENNIALTQLNGLSGVTHIDGYLNVINNDALVQFNDLANLDSIGMNATGGIVIRDNPLLTSIPQWNNLGYVNWDITIKNNNQLASLTGWNNLDKSRSILISNNPVLSTINNFMDNVNFILGALSISNNNQLTSVLGFQKLDNADGFFIYNNPLLNDLSGFVKLIELTDLTIETNNALTDLNYFPLLNKITTTITITDNQLLTNLSGLKNVSQLSFGLTVTNNPVLTDCSGLCQLLNNIGGPITISGNPAPCDNQTNLEEDCTPPPANDDCENAINLVVNPSNDCTSQVSGTTIAATESLSGCNFETDPIKDVWYSFTATQNVHKVKISNLIPQTGNFGSVLVEIFSGGCNSLSSVSQCQRFFDGETYYFTGLSANTDYQLRVYTDLLYGPANFSICLQATNPPANDDSANAINLTQALICNNTLAGTVEDATESAPNIQMCNGNFAPTANDVWYTFTASTSSATFSVEPVGMIFEPVIELFEGNPNNYVTCSYMNAPGIVEMNMNNLNIGATYYFRIFHGNIQVLYGSEAAFNICLHELPTIQLGQTFGNNCEPSSVSHNSTGSGNWLHYDFLGQLIFSIQDSEPMGTITAEFYTNHNGIRSTANGVEVLDRNFEISPTNDPVNPVPVRFYITVEEFNDLVAANDGDDNDINNLSDFVIMRYSGVTCANTPLNGGVLHPVTGWGDLGMSNYYLEVSFADFSSFFLTGGANALPLELLKFEGRSQEDRIYLSWETGEEINHSHFEIQHSIDAVNFFNIGKVYHPIMEGLTQQYSYNHDFPNEGINYYRLKQIDYDDIFEYSSVISINFENNRLYKPKLFPNPTADQIQFSTPIEGRYSIINVLGEILKQGELSSNASIDVHSLKTGSYYLMIENTNSGRQYFSFIKT